MGHGSIGKAIFPLNAGYNESHIIDSTLAGPVVNTDFDYDSHADRKTEAYMSTSVNPIFVQNQLLYENSIDTNSTQAIQNSANFLEIRKTSYNASIVNELADEIGNRIYPANTTLTDYALNRDETHSFKIKVYDSAISNAETNRKFVYATSSGTDYPSTNEVGLDIKNYDYFILLNPQIFEMGTDTLRPHFAKITRIVAFDEFGDGIEFSPAYPTTIGKNTKFEIYKGPEKTATDVVAVSYGLRGDTSASTPKHDRVNICSLPTWYFYNDRLDEKNQLDYMTKYNLTHLRWWDYSTDISMAEVDEHTRFESGSDSARFTTSNSTNTDKLSLGMSLFSSGNVFLGNIKNIDSNYVQLDYARVTIDEVPANIGPFNVKIGKTIHNVVFRTEAKFNNTIPNIGREQLDAILVDTVLTSDTSASTNFYKWDTAFPNMHRHTANLRTATLNTKDGDLTGPVKYITFEKANFKNNKIAMVQDSILNNPRNKMSQLAQIDTLDNQGLQHLKIQEEDTLVIQKNIFNSSLSKIAFAHGTVSRHASETNKFELKDIKQETDLRHILSTDDMVEIDGYYYAVNVVSAQSDGIQAFTIKDKKLIAATTWTGSAVAENISNKTLYLMPYNSPSTKGIINCSMKPDTEIEYASDRLSMSGITVDKLNTKLYNARMVVGQYSGHDNKIDMGDRDNKFLRLQDPNRVMYQRSNEATGRFYYYQGAYAISDTVFTGIVEDISSKAEQGMTIFSLTGRDDTSKLLSKTITRNTTHSSDILHSSTPIPSLTATTVPTITNVSISGQTVSWSGVDEFAPHRHAILFNQVGELVGEVKELASSTSLTLYHNACPTPTATTSLKYYHPYNSSYVNFISGTKALASNDLHAGSSTNGFVSISEKGFGFNDGLKLGGTFNTTTATFTTSLLQGTSNTGNYLEDRTLGYDISSPQSVSTNDSTFAFNIGDENGVTITKNSVATVNKESLDVVKITEKAEGTTTLQVAPVFPIVLGRIDTNSSDTRGNCNFYLVNSNIDTGGFLHRLQDTFVTGGIYAPKETIRYWDLQSFSGGTIERNHDSIYRVGKRRQMLQGYAVGYGVKASGTVFTPSPTNDSKPLAGSNTLDGWTYLSNFYQPSSGTAFIKSYPTGDYLGTANDRYTPGGTVECDLQYSTFEQIDPRAETYELLATGDLFPDSKLKANHLGYHASLSYADFGIMLQSESETINTTTHAKYNGQTKQTYLTDDMYEESTISSASQDTSASRRFGVMRLVEATFDWHFNPVDYESLPPADEIPTVKYFDYVMLDATPTLETSTDTITVEQGSVVSESGLTEVVGDVYYTTDYIGSNPSGAYRNNSSAVEINGFVAHYMNNDWTTLNSAWGGTDRGGGNSLMDDGVLGDSTHDNLLKFTGNSDILGVQPFRIFRTGDYNIDNLDSTLGGGNLKAERFNGAKNIRFSHVWLCSPTIEGKNFKWSWALRDDDAIGDIFYPHNIILPLITEEIKGTWSNGAYTKEPDFEDRKTSPFHYLGGGTHIHMSRVMAGLYHKEFSNSSDLVKLFKFGTGITSASSGTVAHIYDNCIGIFRGFKQGITNPRSGMGLDLLTTDIVLSTPLSLDTDTNYENYITNYADGGVNEAVDQHSRNLMIQDYNMDDASTTLATAYTDGGTTLYLEDVSSFGETGSGFINGVPFTWTGKNQNPTPPYLTVPDLNANYAVGVVVANNTTSLAMVGTRSESAFLGDLPALVDSNVYSYDGHLGSRYYTPVNAQHLSSIIAHDYSSDGDSTGNSRGSVFSAQMLVKPTFDITDGSNGVDLQTANTEVEFTLGSNSKHAWLSYLPDLTGYYLVSENIGAYGSTTLRNVKTADIVRWVGRITAHSITTDPTTSNTEKQKITLDQAFVTGTYGTKYRLMRPSEVTFDELEDKIQFNTILSDGKGRDWRTGGEGVATVNANGTYADNLHYSESAYYMYLLLDIDNSNAFLERRTAAAAIASFANVSTGDVLDMHVTDGINEQRKKFTISKTITIGEEGSANLITRPGLELAFDGKLTGNGVVSFGEIFEIILGRRPKLKNIKKCFVGTTFSIGSNLEKEIENMVKEAGLEYNNARSFSNPTGNIVNSGTTSATTITCTANVTGIEDDDIIYSYDGHLIGKVSDVTAAVITFTKKYYVPVQYDELIKINKKTFVTNLKFDDSNMYNAINSLIVKKGLDYSIKNGTFVTRNIEDTSNLRKFSLSYQESGRLVSVKSNKSMFDKANKIIVIGDKIKYELEQPTKKQTRTAKVIDPSIKTEIDAQTRAIELLDLHSDDVRKIEISLQKEGLELIEAGDIVRLNFPNHNIPVNDYIVFEIENVLAGTLKMTVGTFNKTIAERLSELGTQQSSSSTTQFKKDALEISAGKFLFDTINLKQIGVSYEIVGPSNALSYNSNMGFDDILGFTEEIGFEHSTVTKKSYGGRFYEQEDYI